MPWPPVLMFNLCLPPELLQRQMTWLLDDPVLSYLLRTGPSAQNCGGVLVLHLDPAARTACEQRLAALHGTLSNPDGAHWLDEVSALSAVFSALSQGVRRNSAHAATLDARARLHDAVRRILLRIEGDIAREWTIAELAHAAYLDPSYLIRLFRQHVGLSPMAYLARLRAEHAATLLLRSEKPLNQIAREVGWPEPSYFARRFRAVYGQSPRDYRNSYHRAKAASASLAQAPPLPSR